MLGEKNYLNNDRVNITNSVLPSNFSRHKAVHHLFLPAYVELNILLLHIYSLWSIEPAILFL